MTLPKKKKGFRSLTVNEQIFNWRVKAFVDIRSGIFPETKICLDLEWTPVEEGYYKNKLVITPKLVREAILFALENNWDPAVKTDRVFSMRYEKNQFYLKSW